MLAPAMAVSAIGGDGAIPSARTSSLYGADRRPGDHAHLYAGWDSLDLDARSPHFPNTRFDGFLLSHVIEHLATPQVSLSALARLAALPAVAFSIPTSLTLF